MEYLVTWAIDIDADDPAEAARLALEWMRDPDSTAVVFAVTGKDGVTVRVDLEEE